MTFTIQCVETFQMFRKLKSGTGRVFIGTRFKVTLNTGSTVQFKIDRVVLYPRILVSRVLEHISCRTGLPKGVTDLVTKV